MSSAIHTAATELQVFYFDLESAILHIFMGVDQYLGSIDCQIEREKEP